MTGFPNLRRQYSFNSVVDAGCVADIVYYPLLISAEGSTVISPSASLSLTVPPLCV